MAPQEYDDLIDRLRKRNDEIRSQIDGNRGPESANDLVDKLRRLRERAEETSRGHRSKR